MIKKIVLKNFKCFKEETFDLDPHVVFAGHNNSGKTTVIQAISAWHFALQAWIVAKREERSIGLVRKEFAPVPLREFNQLWNNKSTGFKKGERGKFQGAPRPLEIEIHGKSPNGAWSLAMEFKYKNKDQIYVKAQTAKIEIPKSAKALNIVHIPSFSGISTEEIEFNRAYQDTLIGQGKPGDILRNLLLEVSEKKDDWNDLHRRVERIFGYTLARPSPRGQAFILCEYRPVYADGTRGPLLDISTAGSGFQQVLLLLAFLYARPASVLLIDEPDAHLHFNLQDEIYHLLKEFAEKRDGQLIIATHSEVLINATDPKNIMSFLGKHPKRLVKRRDREQLQEAMKLISSLDLLKSERSDNCILFLEGQSDFEILRAWARVLEHRLYRWLNQKVYLHDMKGKEYKKAREHFNALRSFCPQMKGFILLDSDNKKEIKFTSSGDIILKQWERYETESYLVHLDAIKRFFEKEKTDLFGPYPDRAENKLRGITTGEYLEDPLNDPSGYLKLKKGSDILAEVFSAAKLPIGKGEYHSLAAVMKPEEIHPDVSDMLDAIADHFGINE